MPTLGKKLRSPLYVLIACLTFLALVLPAGPHAAAQTSTAAGTPVPTDNARSPGHSVRIQNALGNLQVDAAVTALLDPHPSITASRRGYRVVGVNVTLTNLGSATFERGQSQILLLDDAGLYVWEMPYSRYRSDGDEERLAWSELKPGESVSGWLYYELLSAAKPGGLLYVGYEADPLAMLLARFRSGSAGAADAVMNRAAVPLGTITVEQILTQFERTDPSITPFRGTRTVALVVTVQNNSDQPWDLDSAIYLVDQYGVFYYRVDYERSAASRDAFPEFRNRVRAGQSERGVMLFELPVESTIDLIAYIPNQDQFIVLGDAYSSITVTPEQYVQTADNEEWGSSAPGCEGIREWAEGSGAAMKLAQDIVTDMQSDPEQSTPDSLRSAASSLRITAQVQEAIAPPLKARDAHADMIALLYAAADALDDAAKRIENGESPEVVAKAIDSPRSPFMRAATKAVGSLLAVTVACPLD